MASSFLQRYSSISGDSILFILHAGVNGQQVFEVTKLLNYSSLIICSPAVVLLFALLSPHPNSWVLFRKSKADFFWGEKGKVQRKLRRTTGKQYSKVGGNLMWLGSRAASKIWCRKALGVIALTWGKVGLIWYPKLMACPKSQHNIMSTKMVSTSVDTLILPLLHLPHPIPGHNLGYWQILQPYCKPRFIIWTSLISWYEHMNSVGGSDENFRERTQHKKRAFCTTSWSRLD